MGNSNMRKNNDENNYTEVDSDGFILDSDLETEDDNEFDTEIDDEEHQNEDNDEDEDEEFDDMNDAHDRTFQNDDDDDRCTTPPSTPGPTRPPPTPSHRRTSYGGSSVEHRSELRDREDVTVSSSHGVVNPSGGPTFVDKSPEFRRRSLKFRTDKRLFADDVLESKGSPPFRTCAGTIY